MGTIVRIAGELARLDTTDEANCGGLFVGDWMFWGLEAAGTYGHVLKTSPSEGLAVRLSSDSISRISE